jgi:hypothetical protein
MDHEAAVGLQNQSTHVKECVSGQRVMDHEAAVGLQCQSTHVKECVSGVRVEGLKTSSSVLAPSVSVEISDGGNGYAQDFEDDVSIKETPCDRIEGVTVVKSGSTSTLRHDIPHTSMSADEGSYGDDFDDHQDSTSLKGIVETTNGSEGVGVGVSGNRVKSPTAANDDDYDYGDDFENSVESKSTVTVPHQSVLVVAEHESADDYGDDDFEGSTSKKQSEDEYEDEYADDEFD